jgi:Do/DeqQ family serine protease
MKKNLFFSGLTALIVSVSSLGLYALLYDSGKIVRIEHIEQVPGKAAVYTLDSDGKAVPLDFNETAESVLEGVVHIKSTQVYVSNTKSYQYRNIPDPLRDFFGDEFEQFFGPRFHFDNPQQGNKNKQLPTRIGTGSGVIISGDGYIVTNNHVIADSDDIEVTLHDNRVYKASVVGTDPSTDLALIQIKEKDLPTVPFVNSDQVKIGQWVMAMGNPMGLNSTVTAGIVSAKGRNINILKDKYAVENFIQTDAAINPGNSGGALVNLEGGLVGINTAIASPTGTFAGYGFAVPSNIVQKVIKDLLEYGVVQRGILGVMIRNVDGNFAKEKDLDITQGVYVDSLLDNSAAGKAGIQVGDVITAINDITVHTSSELQGLIARYRPGQEVEVKVLRGDKEKMLNVTLNNRDGNPATKSKESREVLQILGAELEALEDDLLKKLDISGGVKVSRIYAGKLRKYTQMREGFIITSIDGKQVRSVDQVVEILENKAGGVMLEGVYEDIPGTYYYAFGI